MNVAFIGLGTMGAPMAFNILKSGYALTVHNRTRLREKTLEKEGAIRAGTPKAAAAGADVIITCLSDTPDVESVVLGEKGVVEGAKPGAVVVDMSTISPSVTRMISQTLRKKEIRMVDAPVSGGSEGARNATLAIMMGGDAEDIQTVRPVLETMGKNLTHVGPTGAGQLTKAINQIVIAATYWGVAEGIGLGIKAGLDMDKVLDAIGGGAAGSWVLGNRSANMIQNDYPLGFRVKLHRKDLNIALEIARELGVALPVAAYVEQMETSLMAAGHGDEDVSAVARCVRRMSGIE